MSCERDGRYKSQLSSSVQQYLF